MPANNTYSKCLYCCTHILRETSEGRYACDGEWDSLYPFKNNDYCENTPPCEREWHRPEDSVRIRNVIWTVVTGQGKTLYGLLSKRKR